jgi:hypothetical protein
MNVLLRCIAPHTNLQVSNLHCSTYLMFISLCPKVILCEHEHHNMDVWMTAALRGVVVGGSHGIGLAVAKAFLARGRRIIVTGTSQSRLDTARLALDSDQVFLERVDVTDLAAVREPGGMVESRLDVINLLRFTPDSQHWSLCRM